MAGGQGIALLLAALSLAVAFSNAVADDNSAIANFGKFRAVLVGVVPAVAIIAGLWLATRWPTGGRFLVISVAIVFGVKMWWTIVAPALVLLLIWSALVARAPITEK